MRRGPLREDCDAPRVGSAHDCVQTGAIVHVASRVGRLLRAWQLGRRVVERMAISRFLVALANVGNEVLLIGTQQSKAQKTRFSLALAVRTATNAWPTPFERGTCRSTCLSEQTKQGRRQLSQCKTTAQRVMRESTLAKNVFWRCRNHSYKSGLKILAKTQALIRSRVDTCKERTHACDTRANHSKVGEVCGSGVLPE